MNVGNTCYFNSLMQTYFSVPELVQKVFAFKTPEGEEKDQETHVKFIKHLQILFAKMISSNSKFVDPSDVLSNMTDSFGEKITFADGKQKDVHEFHMQFIESLNQALNAKKIAEVKLEEAKADSSEKKGEGDGEMKDQEGEKEGEQEEKQEPEEPEEPEHELML